MRYVALCLLLPMAVGCGRPAMVSVKGIVTYNGKPLKGCKVSFTPSGTDFNPDRHGYGFGITDANGAYEVQHPEGSKGIFPGTYKVTFVAWVDKKGQPVPPDAKPSEYPGGVVNLLPPKYESQADTPETVTVPSGGLQKDFNLTK
ncbi:MAG: hypothetical protein EBV06_07375 [Planctomycetia bacterium]|nr:hypothetical protein [Planctomycetia bacterium]